MRVIVCPPYGPTQPGFVVALDSPTQQYATENGVFVDYNHAFIMGEVIQFPRAKDAITFAEIHGWTVINKASSESILNPSMR